MTFEQFQATREWCEDLTRRLPDECWGELGSEAKPAKGNVYINALYIERVQDWWPQEARDAGGWHLRLNNLEFTSDELLELERWLYEYALGEEMT